MTHRDERTLPDELIPRTAALLVRGARVAALASSAVVLPAILLGFVVVALAEGRSDVAPHLAFFVGGSGFVVGVVALHAVTIAAFALALQETPGIAKAFRRAFRSHVSLIGPALGFVVSPVIVAAGTSAAIGGGFLAAAGAATFAVGSVLYSAALAGAAETLVAPHPVRPRWGRPWYVEAVIGIATPIAAVAVAGPSFTSQVGLPAALPTPLIVSGWVLVVWGATLASSAAAVAFVSRRARPAG